MAARRFDIIFKTGRNQTAQCKACGVKSPSLREGEILDKWCEDHVCGQENEEVADPAPKVETPPDPDKVPEEKTEEVVLTREELEAMTKRDIMAAHAPEWDGTKADLIDHLLGEEEEENSED